jgi:hypothetical protein
MRKLLFAIVFLFAFFAGFSIVGAKEKPEKREIPEVDGVYDDPDFPGIKVRVLVHKEKPGKTSTGSLVCSLDPDSSTAVHWAGWKLPSTWVYNLNPSSVPTSVGGGNLETIAKNGFADWSAPTGVTFNPGSNTTINRQAYDLKNIIAWGRAQGSALAVTYIRYYSSTGLVVDVDTIMNLKYPWKWANSSTCADSDAYDAENILTHEQGHWVGMNDEYNATSYQNATMYGYGSKGEVKKVTLTSGDVSGAAAIYLSP